MCIRDSVTTEEMNETTPRPRFSGMSIDKARTMLGYKPQKLKEVLANWEHLSSNKEAGEGYSDILIETDDGNEGIIIEVKYAEDGNLSAACERALKQIEQRKYDEEFRENGVNRILKYGIACYMKRCKVILYQD